MAANSFDSLPAIPAGGGPTKVIRGALAFGARRKLPDQIAASDRYFLSVIWRLCYAPNAVNKNFKHKNNVESSEASISGKIPR
jgi:hypothetical protein